MPLFFSAEAQTFLSNPAPDARAGALVRFHGVVRAKNRNKSVSHLYYEAYESLACEEFAKIEVRAKKQFAIDRITAWHRLGRVETGEIAVIVDVYAAHRAAAFHAARFVMDELKKSVPIWKCEFYVDGTKSWDAGLCACDWRPETLLGPVNKALMAQNYDADLIRNKTVVLIGAGGLGCPMALTLAALGIKKLIIVDGDVVELSNLARQFCYTVADVGVSKSFLLAEFLRARFPFVVIDTISTMFDETNVHLIDNADLIIDTTDSLPTKAWLAALARRAQKDFMSLSVHQDEGEITVIPKQARDGCFSCHRAIRDEEGCSMNGVFTHACLMVAAHAGALVLDVLAEKMSCSMMQIVRKTALVSVALTKDPSCKRCSPFPIKQVNHHDSVRRGTEHSRAACTDLRA